jgi:hypothetical protein
MQNRYRYLTLLATCTVITSARAQGNFQNLDFESASLPSVPAGQYGGFVSFGAGLPGWTGYEGTNQTGEVLQNNLSGGSVNISVLGPDWGNSLGVSVLDGSYSAVLQAGDFTFGSESASIAQMGLIPASAKSIQMKIEPLNGLNTGPSSAAYLGVMIAGQNVVMVPLSSTADYTIYGGDVSAFAGQTNQLEITSESGPGNYALNSLELDDITFSTQPIPEPGALGLFGLGALGIRWRFRRARG